MKFILRKVKRLNARFKKLPHWARDLFGILSYVNFLGLIPTLWAIAFTPRHFFRRLPLVLQYRRTTYKTPIKFFTNSATLFVTVFFLRHADLAREIDVANAVWYMLMLIPITPFAMVGLSLVLIAVYQLPRLIPTESAFPRPNPYPLYLVSSFKTYRNINWVRFFWGLFYIGIYFVISWQFAQIFMVYVVDATRYLLVNFETQKGFVEFIIAISVITIVAFVIQWLVIRPYSEMLRMSLKKPLPVIFKSDAEAAGFVISDFLANAENRDPTKEDVTSMILGLEIPIASVEQAVREEDIDYADVNMDPDFREQRSKVFAEAFEIEELRSRLNQCKNIPSQLQESINEVLHKLRALQSS